MVRIPFRLHPEELTSVTSTMKRIALVGLACAALLVASASASSSARWKTIPRQFIGGYYGLVPLAWASDRAWFVKTVGEGDRVRYELVSARVGARGLSSFQRSKLPGQRLPSGVVLGSSVLVGPYNGPTEIAQLRRDGKVGDPRPIPGDPETKAREVKDIEWRAVADAKVGGRSVWVLTGGVSSGLGVRAYMAACCTESGKARDLSSLLLRKSDSGQSYTLRVDRKGRLWFFWTASVKRGGIRAVQLDPRTLAPGTAHTAPGRDFDLACAAACRAVFQSGRRIMSWAGTGAPTKILSTLFGFAGNRCRPVANCGNRDLRAAGYRGSRLAVAYSMFGNRSGYTVEVGRGNAKGRHLRSASSATVPRNMAVLSALFTPRGVVFLAGKSGYSRISKVRAAVLR